MPRIRLWKLIARELRSRPGRATLTLLSIAIAVAAVVAVSLGTAAARRASREMYESITGRAELEVVQESGGTYDERVVATIAQTPGVAAAIPVLRQLTVLYAPNSRVRLLSLGIEPKRDTLIRNYKIVAGQFLGDEPGILLPASLARELGVGVGDEVKLLTRWGVRSIPVQGLLAPQGIAGLNQGGIVLLPLPVAQSYFNQQGRVSATSLVLSDSADPKAVLEELSHRLPKGLVARRPVARSRLAEQTLQGIDLGLSFAYALIIVLGLFLILNTFLMNVGERRRQLAILRAIGASRGQLVGMLLGEGLILGLVGTAIGLPAGLGGAHLLADVMARIRAAPSPQVELAAFPFVLGAAIGIGMALVAAYFPARIAGQISPVEGMRPSVSKSGGRIPVSLLLFGLGVYAAAAIIVHMSIQGYLPIGLVLPTGVILLMASVILVAALLGPMARAVGALLAPLVRVESSLARRQLLRRRARTILTVGVLYLAVATGIGLGTTIINNIDDVRRWYRQTMVGDFFLTALGNDSAAAITAAMPDGLGDELRAIPGVTDVSPVRMLSTHVGDLPVVVIAGNFASASELPIDLDHGDPKEVARRLGEGEVVIGTTLAERAGLRPGDDLTLQSPHGPVRLRIAATMVSYTVGGLVLCIERSVAHRLLGIDGADLYVIRADPSKLDDVHKRLEALAHERGLVLHSLADLRRMLNAALMGVVGSLWSLLVLGFVVAAFGVANTLVMNVLEQTREIALLRIIGMTRGQVRKTIVTQAAIMGIISVATGLVGGLLTAYTISRSLLPLVGHHIRFVTSPWLIAGCFAAALVLVLAAAWWPAQRAARMNLLIALHYE